MNVEFTSESLLRNGVMQEQTALLLWTDKKRGVSKEEFDAEVFAWRVALGKVKRSSGQR